MSIPAFQNINSYSIVIAGIVNELSAVVPPSQYIIGSSYENYVGKIQGFIKATADYSTLPPSAIIAYTELAPTTPSATLAGYASNQLAKSAGLVAGNLYYTDSSGEYIVKVVH